MICISVVSHGQSEIAARFLQSLAALSPALVSQVVYTRNILESDMAPIDLEPIALTTIDNPQPRGFGQNHNAAVAYCTQPYFCVVNPDILLPKDPFPALLQCMEDERLGLVAPLVTTPALTVENTARSLYTPPELIRQKLRPENRGAAPDWLAGMFMLFRSEAYRSIGGFDEGYFLYIEDVDICTRLRLAGWELAQCQSAAVIHDAQRHSHRSPAYMRWHLLGMLRYWRTPSFWQYRRLLRAGDYNQKRVAQEHDRSKPA